MPLTDATIICFIPNSTWHLRDMDKGILHCELCDDEIHKPRDLQVYCPPCKVINRRVEKIVNHKIKRRLQGKPTLSWIQVGEMGNCGDCGDWLIPTKTKLKFCKRCKKKRDRASNKRHRKRKKREYVNPNPVVGEMRPCARCDELIKVRNGNHRYCQACNGRPTEKFIGTLGNCVDCNTEIIRKGTRQRYCPPCAKTAIKHQNRKLQNASRKKAGRQYLGMTKPCPTCGNDMIFRSSAQKRCKACSKEARNAKRRKRKE